MAIEAPNVNLSFWHYYSFGTTFVLEVWRNASGPQFLTELFCFNVKNYFYDLYYLVFSRIMSRLLHMFAGIFCKRKYHLT